MEAERELAQLDEGLRGLLLRPPNPIEDLGARGRPHPCLAEHTLEAEQPALGAVAQALLEPPPLCVTRPQQAPARRLQLGALSAHVGLKLRVRCGDARG